LVVYNYIGHHWELRAFPKHPDGISVCPDPIRTQSQSLSAFQASNFSASTGLHMHLTHPLTSAPHCRCGEACWQC